MRGEARTIREIVIEVRARLARIAGRRLLITRAGWAIAFGAAAAATRPLLLPLGDHNPLWTGVARAAGLLLVGTAMFAAGLVWVGRRRRPSELAAARAIDGALDLHEVVASGFAFEREGRAGPEVELATTRAAAAASALDARAAFPLPGMRPRRKTAALAAAGVAGALAIGAYDPVLVSALLSPPTLDEREAAADLVQDADELAAKLAEATPDRSAEKHPGRDRSAERFTSAPSMASKAREAADAARRGDRKGALDKLDDLRAAAMERSSRAEGLGSALERMADALDAPKAESRSASSRDAARPSDSASDALRLLAKKVRDGDPTSPESQAASRERTLERLERAADDMKKAFGERGQSAKDSAEDRAAAERAAASMEDARAALSRGDAEAAAKLLEQAAEHVEAIERARAAAAAEARLAMATLERSGALERAIQMAMLGQDGQGQGEGQGQGRGQGKDGQGQGEGEGQGEGRGPGRPAGGGDLRAAIAARLAVLGLGDPSGQPGEGGGHVPDRHRARRDPLEAQGAIRAPSAVSEGERAIQAMRGLGKGSDPPASYREVFPSYDAAAEEGMADERIPAQRRAVVRRYFETIRP